MSTRDGLATSSRLEAFSDGVLAIAITLLVLDLRVPAHEPGTLLHALGLIWPSYLAYVASFFYIGVVWLNHHAAFTRIRMVDRGLLAANLLLLLFTSVLPFPTAVLADSIRLGSLNDQRAAIGLYGLISTLMAASWLLFYHYLHHSTDLAHAHVPPVYFGVQRRRAVTGIIGFLLATLLGITLSPLFGLALFIALPLFYAITSEGIRPRPQPDPAQHVPESSET